MSSNDITRHGYPEPQTGGEYVPRAALDAANADAEALAEALRRLASQEGFGGALYVDPASAAWRELALRADFAAAALAAHDERVKGE